MYVFCCWVAARLGKLGALGEPQEVEAENEDGKALRELEQMLSEVACGEERMRLDIQS